MDMVMFFPSSPLFRTGRDGIGSSALALFIKAIVSGVRDTLEVYVKPQASESCMEMTFETPGSSMVMP
jgi:hypothetical protein